jgi:hypothetical protein
MGFPARLLVSSRCKTLKISLAKVSGKHWNS